MLNQPKQKINPIRLILADKQPVARMGLKAALQATPDLVVVAEATDGETIQTLCHQLAPDILLLSLNVSCFSLTQLLTWLKDCDIRILVLAHSDDETCLRAMIAANVAGYMLKDEPLDIIIKAIRMVGEGGSYSSEKVLEKLAQSEVEHIQFSDQEILLLELMAAGKINREMAYLLDVSEKAIEKYLRQLFVKLEVQTRTEAAVKAVKQGLISGEWPPSQREIPTALQPDLNGNHRESPMPEVRLPDDIKTLLTEREQRVVCLLAQGLGNDQIAVELHLAEQTVRNYVSRIYDKIGVTSRVEAVVWVRERGFV